MKSLFICIATLISIAACQKVTESVDITGNGTPGKSKLSGGKYYFKGETYTFSLQNSSDREGDWYMDGTFIESGKKLERFFPEAGTYTIGYRESKSNWKGEEVILAEGSLGIMVLNYGDNFINLWGKLKVEGIHPEYENCEVRRDPNSDTLFVDLYVGSFGNNDWHFKVVMDSKEKANFNGVIKAYYSSGTTLINGTGSVVMDGNNLHVDLQTDEGHFKTTYY